MSLFLISSVDTKVTPETTKHYVYICNLLSRRVLAYSFIYIYIYIYICTRISHTPRTSLKTMRITVWISVLSRRLKLGTFQIQVKYVCWCLVFLDYVLYTPPFIGSSSRNTSFTISGLVLQCDATLRTSQQTAGPPATRSEMRRPASSFDCCSMWDLTRLQPCR